MATKKAPRNFTDLLDDVQAPGSTPTTTAPKKGPLLTFHIDDDLKIQLDRVVFWQGRSSSQRVVLNQALRQLLSADPNSQRLMPDE